jgi:hypothetical protein
MIARDAPVDRFVADCVKPAPVRSQSLRSANVYLDANPRFQRSVLSNLRLSFTFIPAHEKFLVGVALAIPIFTQVPSRFMLELTGASSGDMRLSDHAARSMI